MLPILFHIGSYAVRTYGLVILLAVFLGFETAITLARYTAKDLEVHLSSLAFGVLVGGIVGARAWQVLFFTPAFYFVHPDQILAIWNGGLSIQGGIVGGLLFGIWYSRKHQLNFWRVADLLAPAVILGQAVGRIACLLNGDAFGSPTGRGFGLIYPPGTGAYATFGSQPLWPAEIWEGQMDLVIFAIIFSLSRKKMPQGVLFLIYNILYAVGRLALEYLRGDSPRYFGWTAAQWTSMVVIVVAVILILWLCAKKRRERLAAPIN